MNQNSRNVTMENVLAQLGNRQREIQNMLPPDLPIERFQANIINALRSTPAILDATVNSIVKACMRAAYDGLRIDGKEAAIVVHENTYGKGSDARKVKEAEYFPMAFGLIQQIYRGGEVRSMYAEVIREADDYEIRQGTDRGIHHIKNLNRPGTRIVAAYSVAELMNGGITFEVLDTADISSIREAAKTKKVWERWDGEMSKKSAIRRHRKTLPLGERDIVINDSEAAALYGEIDPGRESLPAPSNQRERPTRDTARAGIESREGTDAGMPMDLGHDEDGVIIEQGQGEQGQGRDGKQRNDFPETDKSEDSLNGLGPEDDMPESEEAWHAWSQDIEADLLKAGTAEIVNEIAKREEKRLNNADKGRSSFLRGLITDRLTDFATGGDEK